jgi:predicted porin
VLSVLFDVGVRYTRTEFTTLTLSAPTLQVTESVESTRDWSGIAEVLLQYQGEKDRARLTLSHDIRQASGRGGTTMRTSAVAWMAHRFADPLEGRFLAGYYRNTSEEGTVSVLPVDETTARLQPSLQYDFTRDLYLQVAYTLTWVKDDTEDSESVQNVVYGLVHWQWPLLE